MSNYQQMSEAAAAARKGYLDYQQRVWSYLFAIVNGLITHCGVPENCMVWLKWNGIDGPDGRFTFPDHGGHYTLPGATTYDARDNSFNLGVLIYMTPENHNPRLPVTFALWVSERNGTPLVRIGRDGRARQVELQDEAQRNLFCEDIAREIVEAFAFPSKEDRRPIGFDIGSLGDDHS